MKLLRCTPLVWILLAGTLSFCSETLFGQTNEATSTRQSQSVRIVADFDGDHLPDVAVAKIEHSIIRIKIRLASGHTRILLSAPISQEVGLRLTAYDVDDDSNVDLVLTSALSETPLAMWLNTANGQFEKIKGWIAPILEHEADPHFRRRLTEFVEQSIIGSGNPVPPVIAENDLLYTLDEDRQDFKRRPSISRIHAAFNTFERGPPLS